MDERATVVLTPASLLGVTSDGQTAIEGVPKGCESDSTGLRENGMSDGKTVFLTPNPVRTDHVLP
jgi:hypothetical protein